MGKKKLILNREQEALLEIVKKTAIEEGRSLKTMAIPWRKTGLDRYLKQLEEFEADSQNGESINIAHPLVS